MLARRAGRVFTSPWAFFAAGVFDFVAFFSMFGFQWARAQVMRRWARAGGARGG